jgi:hypothetical protein
LAKNEKKETETNNPNKDKISNNDLSKFDKLEK